MKQKIVLFITTMALVISVTACGQNGDKVLNETSTVEGEATEQMTVEETEVVVVQPEQTESVDTEITEIDKYGFDVYANAKEKFKRLNDAYWDILDGTDHPGALFLEITQNNAEKGTSNNYDPSNEELNMYLSNGERTELLNSAYAILHGYYGNRINNGEDWYDIKEWVAQFDSEDELTSEFFEAEEDGNIYPVDSYMANVAYYAATIANADEVTFGEPVEENFEYSGGYESAYMMPIILDGNDYNIYAIFDADGNLINIDDLNLDMPEEAYVYTWGEDVDYKQ